MKVLVVLCLIFLAYQAHAERQPDQVKPAIQNATVPFSLSLNHASFLNAVKSFEKADLKAAKEVFLQINSQAHPLKAHLHFYLAKIYLQEQQYSKAEVSFKLALDSEPNFNIRRQSHKGLGDTYRLRRFHTEAYSSYKKAFKHFYLPEEKKELLVLLLDQALIVKKKESCKWFTSLFVNHPVTTGKDFERDLKSWTLDSKTWTLNARPINCPVRVSQIKRRMKNFIWNGIKDKPLISLSYYYKTHPQHKIELETSRLLAMSEPDQAFKLYNENYKYNYEELYNFYVASSRADKYLEAEKMIKKIQKLKGLSRSRIQKTKLHEGFLHYEFGSYKKAAQRFKEYLKYGRGARNYGDALWYEAWTTYLSGNFNKSQTLFSNYLKAVQKKKRYKSRDRYSPDRLKYWLAKSHQNLKQTTKAKEIYSSINKDTYYINLAREQIQKINSIYPKSTLPWGNELVVDHSTYARILDLWTENKKEELYSLVQSFYKSAKDVSALKRAKLLNGLGLGEMAYWEVYDLAQNSKSYYQRLGVAWLYEQAGRLDRRSRTLTGLLSELKLELKSETLKKYWLLAHPKNHDSLVNKISKINELSPNFVHGLMRSESFYNPKAHSSVGARGLMQLMPATAKELMRLLGQEDDIESKDLYDPFVNVFLGGSYLGRISKQFNASELLMAASYNAGPHRANWWLYRFGQLKKDEFVEHILFTETRNYVKKVIKTRWIYDELYNSKRGSSKNTFAGLMENFEIQRNRTPSFKESWN